MKGFVWQPLLGSLFVAGVALVSCGPNAKRGAPAEANPTYAGSVATILNQKCVSCHRPDQAAPFSLIGYENAKKWASMAAVATGKKRMPPWKALPADVAYAEDGHLSEQEIATIKAWADAGAPRGDKAKEPKPPTFPVGWRLGEPDMLWPMPYEHELGASGEDEYWNFVITPNITKPTWISAIDVAPGNKKIVHHVIAFLDKKGRGKKLATSDKGDGKRGYRSSGGGIGFLPDGSLGGWAPGANTKKLPADAGFLLEPGTDVILQIHYNKSGKVERDQTKVAVYTQPQTPSERVELAWIANPFIKIEPGKAGQVFKQEFKIPAPIKLYTLMPHMHLLGRSMTAWAVLPGGKQMKLVDVQDWDFNWQLIYELEKPLRLPAGTVLKVEASYDNSKDNPFQPFDPPRLVRWGEETKDEMMLLVAAYSVDR